MIPPEELDWSKVRILTIEDKILRVVREDTTIEYSFGTDRELKETFSRWASHPDAQTSVLRQEDTKTILVVDEDLPCRKEIRNTMEREKFNVLEAATIEQAVQTIGKHDVDVVLLGCGANATTAAESVRAIIRAAGGAPLITYGRGISSSSSVSSAAAGLPVDCSKTFAALVAAVRRLTQDPGSSRKTGW